MVKFEPLVVVPEAFVIAIGPVVVDGTVAVICVLLSMVNVELMPLNFTNVVEKKFEPVMTTVVPIGPLTGLKLPIVGGELELYDCRVESGELADIASAKLVEARGNRISIFDVSDISLHQVREVLGGLRLSLSGWFYP